MKAKPLSPKQLFAQLRLDWLHDYFFDEPVLEKKIAEELSLSLTSSHSALALKWTGTYYKKEILDNETPSLEARWIDRETGFGLFTKEPLANQQFIGTYLGRVRRRSPLARNIVTAYSFLFPLQPKYWFAGYGWGWSIDAMREGNQTRFINHAKEGNCEAVGAICEGKIYIVIRSKRKLDAGQQLLYNYGNDYWKGNRKEPLLLE